MKKRNPLLYSIIANFLIFVLTTISIIGAYKGSNGNLKEVLKYFTNQSNIFCGITALLLMIDGYVSLAGGRTTMKKGFLLLKFAGTLLVTITFLVVFCYLSFVIHSLWDLLYKYNLYLHCVGPLLAIVSFVAFDRGIHIKVSAVFFSMIFFLLYGGLYFYNVLISRRWRDFYSFTGAGKWYISVVILAIVVCVSGSLLMVLHNRCDRSKQE